MILTGCGANGDGSRAAPRSTATGVPLVLAAVVGTGEDVKEDNVNGLEAARDAINAAGGVGGRPVEVRICDDRGDPNIAGKCVRDLIADDKILAFVGSNTPFGDVTDPLIDAAGMANLEPNPLAAADYTSPNTFFSYGGTFASGGGGAAICATDLGARRISAAYLDIGAGSRAADVTNMVLQPHGMKLDTAVPISPTSADLALQVAQLLQSDPDCIVSLATGPISTQLARALRQQGYDGPVTVPGLTHDEAIIKKDLGRAGEGIVVNQLFDITSPRHQEFLGDMRATHGEGVRLNQMAERSWWGLKLFATTLGSGPEISRASILSTYRALKGFDTKGLTAIPLDFTVTGGFVDGTVPNLRSPYVLGTRFKDGALTPITGKWINVFTGKTI